MDIDQQYVHLFVFYGHSDLNNKILDIYLHYIQLLLNNEHYDF
jgi:hypothetical protein